jgi:hypothetical protein
MKQLKPGEVIIEINQGRVKGPADAVAQTDACAVSCQ